MNYYFSTEITGSYKEVLETVIRALAEEGFGILTRIDVRDTLKKKLDVDFRQYTILGACNPPLAHRALQAEDKIGTMLPCNVVVQETPQGTVEAAAVDPVASMLAVENPALHETAAQVRHKLQNVIASLARRP